MLHILEMAEQKNDLENYELISKIKKVLFQESIADRTIVQLEELAENIASLEPTEYIEKLFFLSLKECD